MDYNCILCIKQHHVLISFSPEHWELHTGWLWPAPMHHAAHYSLLKEPAHLGEPAKMCVFFLSHIYIQPHTPVSPPIIELSSHIFFGNFFNVLQKQLFFLSGQALIPPPLLVAGPLKKLLCVFPWQIKVKCLRLYVYYLSRNSPLQKNCIIIGDRML